MLSGLRLKLLLCFVVMAVLGAWAGRSGKEPLPLALLLCPCVVLGVIFAERLLRPIRRLERSVAELAGGRDDREELHEARLEVQHLRESQAGQRRHLEEVIAECLATAHQVVREDLNRRLTFQHGGPLGQLRHGINGMLDVFQRKDQEAQEQRAQRAAERERVEQTLLECVLFVQRLALGDLTEPLAAQKQGTLGQLCLDLNNLAESLHKRAEQLQHSCGAIATASSQILSVFAEQVRIATEQSSAIGKTTVAVDKIKTLTLQAVRGVNQGTRDSQAILDASRQGSQAMLDVINGMGQIRDRVGSTARTILALAEQTQAIDAIITTVNKLADQSNLVALNATIEAARAGEQGKSFAVVAQHVRELAERSKTATAQVRDILGDLQRAIILAVQVTEEDSEGVSTGARLAEQAGQVIQRLATEVEHGARTSAQVVAVAREQTTGMEAIGKEITQLRHAAGQRLQAARQAERAATEIHSLALALQSNVSGYRA